MWAAMAECIWMSAKDALGVLVVEMWNEVAEEKCKEKQDAYATLIDGKAAKKRKLSL